jgi:hypothetical protein
MNRVTLGDGRWFDRDRAEAYEDDTRWDGHNHISLVTGSQFVRSTLWRTASGVWILETKGNYDTTYEFPVREQEAFRWLIDNGHVAAVVESFLQEMEV